MKIILSRKGFDSANGGIVSPIFPDGSMVTLPIPSDDIDTYNDLHHNGKAYMDILSELKYKGEKINCHVDPDIDITRRKRTIPNWKPAFGQIDAAASYLLKTVKVETGDIFLFFGNFHFVEEKDGRLSYTKNTGNFYKDKDIQVIWGYMQVDKIITKPDKIRNYSWHPHSRTDRNINPNRNNMIVTAKDKLSILPEKPGCGLFDFDEKRVLTLKGANKATWIYRSIYSPENVYGNRRNSVNEKYKENGLYYAGIWQELGLYESKDATEWARNVMK